MTQHTAASTERRVTVGLGDRAYDIVIKRGALAEVGERLTSLGLSGKAAVVTNPVVGRLYGATVLRSLKGAGFRPVLVTIPDGERHKTLRSVARVLDALAAARFERRSTVIALGGGVIGDLAGFAALVYQRGIQFVQLPTTLVAQVDSSVGGKTGVNHVLGKNLIGAFYQPRVVVMDPVALKSLPEREWRAGLAEVIKYGVIADDHLFASLEENIEPIVKRDDDLVANVVARSCQIKASVVEQDERESGLRRILNYGHTIGHALESLGHYRRLIHGEAVAIGMVQEALLARRLGLCSDDVVTRQRRLITNAGLPTEVPPVRFAQLWTAMQRDK
ncbi:MAG: 3-dehydroquinate synthase, partial [Nitrospirae bacterium]|nr:3-dehydroquinate synthase [Nitrospirota bacterium]